MIVKIITKLVSRVPMLFSEKNHLQAELGYCNHLFPNIPLCLVVIWDHVHAFSGRGRRKTRRTMAALLLMLVGCRGQKKFRVSFLLRKGRRVFGYFRPNSLVLFFYCCVLYYINIGLGCFFMKAQQ